MANEITIRVYEQGQGTVLNGGGSGTLADRGAAFSAPVPNLSVGDHALEVTAQDTAAGKSESSRVAAGTVTIDPPPTVDIDATYSGGSNALTGDRQVLLTGVNAAAGSLIVVAVAGASESQDCSVPTISDTAGLTWTARVTRSMSNASPQAYAWTRIWTAPAPSGVSADTITVTFPTAASTPCGIATAWVCSGQNASPIGGSNFVDSGASAADLVVSVTVAAVGSRLFGVVCRGNSTANPTWRTDCTQDGANYDTGTSSDVSTGHLTAATSGTGATLVGTSTNDSWSLGVGLEIKP